MKLVARVTSTVAQATSVLPEKVAKSRQCIDSLCENGWSNRIDKPLEIMWDGLTDTYVRGRCLETY